MSAYTAGDGSQNNPFVISDVAGLSQLLTTDIEQGYFAVLDCDISPDDSVEISRAYGMTGNTNYVVPAFTLDLNGYEVANIIWYNESGGTRMFVGKIDVTIKRGTWNVTIWAWKNSVAAGEYIVYEDCKITLFDSYSVYGDVIRCFIDLNSYSIISAPNQGSYATGAVENLTDASAFDDPFAPENYPLLTYALWVKDGVSYPRISREQATTPDDDHDPATVQWVPPWWMDGQTLTQAMAEPAYLVKGMNAFWAKVRGWLLLPLQQRDPLTCNEQLLTLLAWDRDITRFNGEPLELFRLRVKYAWQNARDAGGAAGFLQIFERLGLTINELRERQLGVDWDVITIVLDDENTASNAALFQTLIQHYGRTCRRYYFQVQYPTDIHHRAGHFGLSQQVFTASLE